MTLGGKMSIRLAFLAILSLGIIACSENKGNPIGPIPLAPTLSLRTSTTSAFVGDSTMISAVCTNTLSFTPTAVGAIVLPTGSCNDFKAFFTQAGLAKIYGLAIGEAGTSPAKDSVLINVSSRMDTVNIAFWSMDENDAPPQGLKARVVWWQKSGVQDSLESAFQGNTSSVVIPAKLDSAIVSLIGDPNYFPMNDTVRYKDYYHQTLSYEGIRRVMKSHLGPNIGQSFAVSLEDLLAKTSAVDDLSFFLWSGVFSPGGKSIKTINGWPVDQVLPIGINLAKSPGATASDSVFINQTVIPNLNTKLGRQRFVPGVISGTDSPTGMVEIVVLNTTGEVAVTNKHYISPTSINQCTITLPNHVWLTTTNLVGLEHEMVHCLGIGHTCRWKTVMFSYKDADVGGSCENQKASDLTQKDLAMLELFDQIRSQAKIHQTLYGFFSAVQGHALYDKSP